MSKSKKDFTLLSPQDIVIHGLQTNIKKNILTFIFYTVYFDGFSNGSFLFLACNS